MAREKRPRGLGCTDAHGPNTSSLMRERYAADQDAAEPGTLAQGKGLDVVGA